MKQLRDSIDSPSSDHYNKFFRRAFVKKKKKKKTGILFKVFAERNLIGVTGLLCFCNSRTHGWTWTDKKKHGTIVSLTIFCLFVVSQEYQSNLLISANLFDYSADINQEIEAFLKRCLFSCWDSFVKFMKYKPSAIIFV